MDACSDDIAAKGCSVTEFGATSISTQTGSRDLHEDASCLKRSSPSCSMVVQHAKTHPSSVGPHSLSSGEPERSMERFFGLCERVQPLGGTFLVMTD